MAIRTMTSEEQKDFPNVETVRDYRGHEEGLIQHGSKCPLHNKIDTSGKHSPECAREGSYSERCGEPFRPLYMVTTHVGLVLELGEHNGYDDSDFFAIVWNEEKQAPEEIQYASTRGWTYPNGAAVDATPEVLEKFKAYQTARMKKAMAEQDRRNAARALAEKKVPAKGKLVRVVKGRKVPQGTEGVVIWEGAGDWGPRVGVKDAAGKVHFTAASNVEAVLEDGEPVYPPYKKEVA